MVSQYFSVFSDPDTDFFSVAADVRSAQEHFDSSISLEHRSVKLKVPRRYSGYFDDVSMAKILEASWKSAREQRIKEVFLPPITANGEYLRFNLFNIKLTPSVISIAAAAITPLNRAVDIFCDDTIVTIPTYSFPHVSSEKMSRLVNVRRRHAQNRGQTKIRLPAIFSGADFGYRNNLLFQAGEDDSLAEMVDLACVVGRQSTVAIRKQGMTYRILSSCFKKCTGEEITNALARMEEKDFVRGRTCVLQPLVLQHGVS